MEIHASGSKRPQVPGLGLKTNSNSLSGIKCFRKPRENISPNTLENIHFDDRTCVSRDSQFCSQLVTIDIINNQTHPFGISNPNK